MRMLRPVIALDPRLFGRRFPGFNLADDRERGSSLGDDLKLFVSTFAAGFLFVSVLIF